MEGTAKLLEALEAEHAELSARLHATGQAIKALRNLNGNGNGTKKRGRRTMSLAQRREQSKRMKARWRALRRAA